MKCTDFDRKMLLLATQLSHQSENRLILLAALRALLSTLTMSNANGGESIVEAMTLIRCIIKLVLRLLTEPSANKCVSSLGRHSSPDLVFLADPFLSIPCWSIFAAVSIR